MSVESQKLEIFALFKQSNVARAKGLIADWGKKELGGKGTDLGKILSISKQSVSLLVSKGEATVKEENLKLTSLQRPSTPCFRVSYK